MVLCSKFDPPKNGFSSTCLPKVRGDDFFSGKWGMMQSSLLKVIRSHYGVVFTGTEDSRTQVLVAEYRCPMVSYPP